MRSTFKTLVPAYKYIWIEDRRQDFDDTEKRTNRYWNRNICVHWPFLIRRLRMYETTSLPSYNRCPWTKTKVYWYGKWWKKTLWLGYLAMPRWDYARVCRQVWSVQSSPWMRIFVTLVYFWVHDSSTDHVLMNFCSWTCFVLCMHGVIDVLFFSVHKKLAAVPNTSTKKLHIELSMINL